MIRLIVDRDRINIHLDIAKVQLNLRAHIHTSHSCTVLSIPAKIIGTLLDIIQPQDMFQTIYVFVSMFQ